MEPAQSMLKGALLALARQQSVYRLVMRHDLLRGLAWRFVAGEELEDAVAVGQALNTQGLAVSLDHLGENVASAAAAEAAARAYLPAIAAVADTPLDAYLSLKLTQMGLDLSPEMCLENLRLVVGSARARNVFVRIDMESSAYTQRTLEIHQALWSEGYRNLGVVLQAALYRTPADLDRLIAVGASVRLCKGAYLEPPHVAWQRKADVDRQYAALGERLLLEGQQPAFATHDERLLRHLQDVARRNRIGPERFELQMLFGVRRDLQLRLASQGYRVRVYLPYGKEWYPYLVRRLAERPANVAFVVGSLIREAAAQRTDGQRGANGGWWARSGT